MHTVQFYSFKHRFNLNQRIYCSCFEARGLVESQADWGLSKKSNLKSLSFPYDGCSDYYSFVLDLNDYQFAVIIQ